MDTLKSDQSDTRYTSPMTQDEIQQRIRRMASRAYWAGLIAGVLIGIAAGLAIGYQLGSPTTVVVPLSQGVRT